MISPAPAFRLQHELLLRARSQHIPTPHSLTHRRRARHGLTVIELLAATVISLIVMGATVQLFGTVGNQISNGRSNIELGDRTRSAIEKLRHDLRGETADLRTWNRAEDASGYFEIVKGLPQYWDKLASPVSANQTPGGTLTGYTNDAIFFTTRSRDLPFVGRAVTPALTNYGPLESQVAEVAWYLQPTSLTPAAAYTPTTPPTYTLYRRQFLVLPGLGAPIATGTPPYIPASQYFDSTNGVPAGMVPLCDISAHPDGTTWPNTNMVLNSLADLSYRENRFGHYYASQASSIDPWGTWHVNTSIYAFGAGTVPFPIYPDSAPASFSPPSGPMAPFPPPPTTTTDPNPRYGDDVVLTNVLSFDIKVWDPGAPVVKDPASGAPLVPSDPGYSANMSPIAYGAYVDLNWNNGTAITNPPGSPPCYFAAASYGVGQKSYLPTSVLSTNPPSPNNFGCFTSYYDTWPAGYEAWLYNPNSGNPQTSNHSYDGLQGPSLVTGTIADGGVDGPNERLTSPPYPVPLRGIQIKIRTYEFTSKQVREVTIQENFVPD